MLAGFGGQEYSTYYSLLGNISYLEAVGNEDKATVTLQLKNKNVDVYKRQVDVNAPIYVFNAPSFPYTTMVAKVQSEDDLLKLLEVTEKEQIIRHVVEADGYSFAQINKQMCTRDRNSARVDFGKYFKNVFSMGQVLLICFSKSAFNSVFSV